MPIIGLTHQLDGSLHIRRTVTTKVAIGLAPEEGRNYPKKLDHFAFLRKEMDGNDISWVVDEEKQDHFGSDCKSFWIILMSDDPDECFRTQMAAFVKTRCWCKGDGEKAERRVQIGGEYKGEFQTWNGPCKNGGCKDAKSINGKPAACKPSGDLYFMLQDFPTLGTICRIHTSSYQSIMQVSSALRDLQAVTGGRLMGISCKLFVSPDTSTYEQGGVSKTGTKYVLGLELAAKDMPQLMTTMSNTARMFQGLQKQLKGAVLDVEEDETERASEIAGEFYYDKSESQEDPEEALRSKADEMLQAAFPDRNQAWRQGYISKYAGKLQELIEKIPSPALKGESCPATPGKTTTETSPSSNAAGGNSNGASSAANHQPSSATTPSEAGRPATRRSARAAQSTPEPTPTSAQPTQTKDEPNIHGMTITDDDFPEDMFNQPQQSTSKVEEKGKGNDNRWSF